MVLTTPPGAEYENCLVTFIDILGFRAMLANRQPQEILQALFALRAATEPDETARLPGGINSRQTDEPFSETISDAVVRARPYETEFRAGALLWELDDLLLAQVSLASRGIFVRGAMTVGQVHVGSDGRGPFFGRGLAEAYELESTVARQPRIIVSEKVLKEHRENEAMQGDHNTLEWEIGYLENFLRRDTDGSLFIHYLNCRSSFDSEPEYRTFLEGHARSIERGYQQANSDPVRSKFLWLRNYHNRSVAELCQIPIGDTQFDVSAAIDMSNLTAMQQQLVALHQVP